MAPVRQDDELPPRVVRVWRSYLEGLGEEPTSPPPEDDGAPLDDRESKVQLELRHEYLATRFDHFVAIPYALFVEAWRCIDGSDRYVLRRAVDCFLGKIRAELGEEAAPGIRRTDVSVYVYAEKREFLLGKFDPDELDLMTAYLHQFEIGGDQRPSVGHAFIRALEDFVADHGLTPVPQWTRTGVVAQWNRSGKEPPRPERTPWVAPPEPADALPRDEVRSVFAELAARE